MIPTALSEKELTLICSVFKRHPEVKSAVLFGSRAKGTNHPASDVDIAVAGNITTKIQAAVAAELDELPLPYKFDLQPIKSIRHQELRGHIERVGIEIYPR